MTNPFRSGLESSLAVEPCVLVIFGATGDLTHRKLVPALYNLSLDGLLPAHFYMVGFARREYSDETFRAALQASVEQHSRRTPLRTEVWSEFAEHSFYCQSAFDDEHGYLRLKERLDELDRLSGRICNKIYYLATSPEYFERIGAGLARAGLVGQAAAERCHPRVIVEKPFGRDLQSAQHLNRALLSFMTEDQIYRIDHYLGKETVQNLLVFRFANGIFEPIWNHKYISHVEISVCESLGVGSRAGYFDSAGIMRDIVQNHALQLLSLVALEPPVAFEAGAVRDEKVKVLRSIRRLASEEVSDKVVRARYLNGSVGGEAVPGYLGEQGVGPDSTAETYVAMELDIDNWRWAGVPFFLRAGKRLPKRITEIAIHFRSVPHRLFVGQDISQVQANLLAFQIQPDEGISLRISSKPPGPQVRVQPVKMDFSYGTSFGIEPPEAYERLLLDCMRGDPTLFTRDDEIEQSWDLLRPIQEAWTEGRGGSTPPIFGYEAGTWGPRAADEMMGRRTGRPWRRL